MLKDEDMLRYTPATHDHMLKAVKGEETHAETHKMGAMFISNP
jgi:hypothetical protein